MKTNAPAPYGVLPSERQLRWHALEYYGFLHFSINTFTGKSWGYGDEEATLFNPTDFDADSMAAIAQEVGMRGLILTAKHHDGFCLWPTKTTKHSVVESPFRKGKGDAVRELADACRRHRIKFGIYLSPWDRNHPAYGYPEYIEVYRQQLRELLTQYGELFEVWHDGANGGDGFYGGAREKRQIDNRTYYQWEKTWAMVRELQPNAVIFSDAGPDIRWVGNESGVAGDPCWATINAANIYPGRAEERQLNQGDRKGTHWIGAECDVSIRPEWFWREEEDAKVRTPENLMELYFQSVGRGASLLLNVPPDRRGRLHENDIASLRGFKKLRDSLFRTDLARKATAQASNTRGGNVHFSPANLIDGKPDTFWATDDASTTPEVTLTFPKAVAINTLRLREYLPLGQRIDAFAVDVWTNNAWSEVTRGESIGNCRLLRIPTVTTDRVRLRITQAPVCPALTEFAVFAN